MQKNSNKNYIFTCLRCVNTNIQVLCFLILIITFCSCDNFKKSSIEGNNNGDLTLKVSEDYSDIFNDIDNLFNAFNNYQRIIDPDSDNSIEAVNIDTLDKSIYNQFLKILTNKQSLADTVQEKLKQHISVISSSDGKLSSISFQVFVWNELVNDWSFFQFINESGELQVKQNERGSGLIIYNEIVHLSDNTYLLSSFSNYNLDHMIMFSSYEIVGNSLREALVFPTSNKDSYSSNFGTRYRAMFEEGSDFAEAEFNSNTKTISVKYKLFKIENGEKSFDDLSKDNLFTDLVNDKGIVEFTMKFDNRTFKLIK